MPLENAAKYPTTDQCIQHRHHWRALGRAVRKEMAFTSANIQSDLKAFVDTKVQARKLETARNIETVLEVLKEVFARLSVNEPRFNDSFNKENGRVDGLQVIAPDHIQLRLYLDQIELFTTVQSGAPNGATFLDIKDERSKCVCIWSEFLTAAGHLSARKIREKFQVTTMNCNFWGINY